MEKPTFKHPSEFGIWEKSDSEKGYKTDKNKDAVCLMINKKDKKIDIIWKFLQAINAIGVSCGCFSYYNDGYGGDLPCVITKSRSRRK